MTHRSGGRIAADRGCSPRHDFEEDDIRVGVRGTGTVGRTIAAKLAEIGHGPVIGSRDPVAALAVTERARPDVETLGEWHAQNEAIPVATFSDAAATARRS